MGVAVSFIARLLQTYCWIAYVGLAIIVYVALQMIYRGTQADMLAVAMVMA